MVKRFSIFVLLFLMGSVATTSLAAKQPKAVSADLENTASIWFEGNRKRSFWLSKTELLIYKAAAATTSLQPARAAAIQLYPQAEIVSENGLFLHIKLPTADSHKQLSQFQIRNTTDPSLSALSGVEPVYYASKSATGGAYALTGQFIVHFKQSKSNAEANAWASANHTVLLKDLGHDHAFLFSCPSGRGCIDFANKIYAGGKGEVKFAYPNWLKPRVGKQFTPNDARFADQWHLQNSGQLSGVPGADVNITPAWARVDGAGVTLAVVDDGLEIGHEDLSANINSALNWDFVDNDKNPTAGDHGTSAAGIAAAVGGNAIGVSGAAPKATLVGIRLLGANTDANEADALVRSKNIISIYSNSWGPADDLRLEGPAPLTLAAMKSAVKSGRNGKGNIYVWAGGNGNEISDNSNFDGYANSRYTIAVAASTNENLQAYYSEPGANLLVNAPSSGGTADITTTDRSGSAGYGPGKYVDDFGGTSAAAPLVAGIVALILQANDTLTWRDVQQILASTAHKNDPSDQDWIQNAAGYWINHKYGFGRVDAAAAVAAAKNWKKVAAERMVSASASPDLAIPDNNGNGVSSELTIAQALSIEFVEVEFSADDHPYWGDLEIVLTSPSGTESVLANSHSGSGNAYSNWRFGVARLLGESAQGVWKLTVRDQFAQDVGTLQSWSLKIFGSNTSTNPTQPPVNDNAPPTLAAMADQYFDAETDITFDISASDEEGDRLTLAVLNLPSGASFMDHGDGTGTLSWHPGSADVGTTTLEFQVSDGQHTSSASVLFTIHPIASKTLMLQVSDKSSRSKASPLEGRVVDDKVYIFIAESSVIKKVTFYLDEGINGTPIQIERQAPYDLAGGTVRRAKAFNTVRQQNGNHYVMAVVELQAGGVETVRADFVIDNH